MHNYNVRAFENLDPPVMKIPVVEGQAGSQSLTYAATFVTICGETPPSTPVVITNGPDTLNGFDKVKLGVESIPAAARYVRFYKNTVDGLRLLGEVDRSIGQMFDSGQAVSSTVPTSQNTSGRPRHLALGFHSGELGGRQEWMDLQAIFDRDIKALGDTIFKDGDVISGCAVQFVSGTTWRLTEGFVYLYGMIHAIDSGLVTLVGTGKEMVGIKVEEDWITNVQDPVLKAHADEEVPPEYAQHGADRLVLNFTWVVDQPGQINVRPFLDGQPLLEQQTTEYSELEKMVNRRFYNLSGDYSVKPFPRKMLPHDTDAAKMQLKIDGGGIASVTGIEIETIAPQFVEVPKARDTESVNNSPLDPYDAPGGAVIGTVSEPFNVDGLAVKVRFGSGNYHTVALTGSGQTALQVANQIANAINAYPTSGTLVSCTATGGKLKIQGPDGKSLTVAAVASDAYSVLGISPGIYEPTGQRIYRVNDAFVKGVSDLSYITEVVEAVTHDGTDHIDTMANTNVSDILGASFAEADAHDGKYDFIKNVDFVKSGNEADFAALGGANPANGQTVYFKYRYSVNAVKGVRVRVRVTDAQIVKGAEDGQDTIIFGSGDAVEVKTGNPVTGLSGEVADVIRILRVNNSSGQSQSQYTNYSLVKNSGALKHESSRIDWSAAGAQGVTPGGQPSTGSTYYLTFEYWRHVTEGDFVTADSYLNDYEEIEYATGTSWNLRDCADFRTVNGKRPVQGDSARFDYEFYLSRVDRVVLGGDGYFQRVAGIPALVPVAPKNPQGPLAIFLLRVPPFTYSPADVVIQNLEIQRKTQQGINEMLAKIERTEYFIAQFLSKQGAKENTAATDAKGIFVDSLVGQKNGDFEFSKNGIEFTAAIDTFERCIRLPVSEDGRVISLDEANSSGFARAGKVLMFAYQPDIYLSQLKATGIINVNPHEVFGWIGTLEIDPEEDFWTDVAQLPAVDTNYDDQLRALAEIAAENALRARQVTWGAWRLTWDSAGWGETTLNEESGWHWGEDSVGAKTYPAQANAARERYGTYSSLVPERTLVDLGERVVDLTVLPYMRQIEINCVAKGLKPHIDIAVSIDGIPADFIETGSTQPGSATYRGKSTIRTSGAGSATGKFTIPEGVAVGKKTVQVFSAANPEESYGISIFYSQGFRETRQRQYMGIISATEREATITESEFHYGDPLAQTFAVTSGIKWVSYVDLYFQSKDTALPVTVEIRETSNGYPSRRVIQTCTLEPADVNVSDDASVATRFTFANPVGYTAGEYCFVVITNCVTYKVWYARLGEMDVRTGQLVRQNPTGGVMFTSPNNSTWESHPEWDLTFEIGTANFENNCQLVFDKISGIEAGMLVLAVTQYLGEGCDLHWMYSLDNRSTWKPVVAGIDSELGQITTEVDLRCDVTGSGGTFQISESGLGIILLLNEPSGWYVGFNGELAEPCDKVTMIVPLAVDGTNGTGTRSATPYYSVDDGETLVELKPKVGYAPVALGDGTYREFIFETADEATITDASNTTPIVITSADHGWTNNTIVEHTGIGGNTAANGTFRVKNATDDTYELVDPVTGADVAGNGAYSGGGTAKLAEYTQLRTFMNLETDNRALTPKAGEINTIAA
jgi:hypothetical protein